MHEIELTLNEDLLEIRFPEEIVEKLGLCAGDTVSATATSSGILITPCNPKNGSGHPRVHDSLT